MKNVEKFFNEFLSKIDNKTFEKKEDIDKKHQKITNEAFKEIIQNKKNFLKNFRDWQLQNDSASPPQVIWEHFSKLGFFATLKLLVKSILFWRHKDFKDSFYDDLKILEITGAIKSLKKNPVHLTPGVKSFFKYKDVYTNYRWNRYSYIAHRIIDQKILNDHKNHLDIGSYYGGLQSFLKKEFEKTNFYMVDFSHQLLRSYIFLKTMFPNSKHIISDEILREDTDNLEDSFIYIPVEKIGIIQNVKFELLTNFFSFGEMKRKTFESYADLKSFKNSENIYLVNRFVSAPFFEKTYDSDLNIFDYDFKSEFNLFYFDVFPIHHYQSPKRLLFDKFRCRPVSSPYFEMIYKKR